MSDQDAVNLVVQAAEQPPAWFIIGFTFMLSVTAVVVVMVLLIAAFPDAFSSAYCLGG